MVAERLRLTTSATLKEKRLRELLGERDPWDPQLMQEVWDAQALGSLELAGYRFRWEEMKAARQGTAPAPIAGLREARAAVPAGAPLSVSALRRWHGALSGGPGDFRAAERTRDGGPVPAPPAFIESRLALLESWLESESGRKLSPAQQAALALARVVEVLPFDDANGRVSRLAASHLMLRGGARPPILVGADAPRLVAALQAAFRFETAALIELLEEASQRAAEVMIQVLQSPR